MRTPLHRSAKWAWLLLVAVLAPARAAPQTGDVGALTNADLHGLVTEWMPGVEARVGVPALVERAVVEREGAGTDEARLAMWSARWGDWIAVAHAAGRVSPEQWGRLLRHDHYVRLRVDGRAEQGQRVGLHLETGCRNAAGDWFNLQSRLHSQRIASGVDRMTATGVFGIEAPSARFRVRGVVLRLFEADGTTLVDEVDMGWGMSSSIGLTYPGRSHMGPFWPRDWAVSPGEYVVELVSSFELTVSEDDYPAGAPLGAFSGGEPYVARWQASDRVAVVIEPAREGSRLEDFGLDAAEIAEHVEIVSVFVRTGDRQVYVSIDVADVPVPVAFRAALVLDDGEREPISLGGLAHAPGARDGKLQQLPACLPKDDCAGALASLRAGTWWIELVADEAEARWDPAIDTAWDGSLVVPGFPVTMHQRREPSD